MGRDADPILLEVFRNAFEAIADQMALILMRTAHSPIVRDAMDFSTALCDAAVSNLAQGLTTPMHLGSFYDAMRHLIRQYEGRIAPGDVFIGNDPYLASGQHLPDIYVIRPVFHGGAPVWMGCTIAHHVDVGGLVPGSNSLAAVEIHQEGLRLPFLKLFDRGVRNATLIEIIRANVRVPDQVLGDIHAQMTACLAGDREFSALLERYGVDNVVALRRGAAGLFRAHGASRHRGDSRWHLSLRRSHRWARRRSAAHRVPGGRDRARRRTHRGLDRHVAAGEGRNQYADLVLQIERIRSAAFGDADGRAQLSRLHAAHSRRRSGRSLVNARYPAPCGARGITGYRMVDCIFGALAQAVPDKVAADGAGGSTLPSFGGWDGKKRFVFSECIMGTWGATSAHDGQEGVPHMASNQANVPVEMIESDYPFRIEHYGFAPDTGGAGRYRGGLGLVREYRILADDIYFGVRSDKCVYPPHGLDGGQPERPRAIAFGPDSTMSCCPRCRCKPITLRSGDVYRHVMAGGGGFGDPFERDPEKVRADVLDGKVTLGPRTRCIRRGHRQCEERRVDTAATRSLRAARRVQA